MRVGLSVDLLIGTWGCLLADGAGILLLTQPDRSGQATL